MKLMVYKILKINTYMFIQELNTTQLSPQGLPFLE